MSKYKHFLLALGFIPLVFIFNHLESVTVPLYTMHTFIDDRIPFLPIFCIPYLLWFPYMAGAVIYCGIKYRPSFYQLLIGLFSGMGIACFIFYIFPNNQDLRPLTYGQDLLSQIVFHIQRIDSSSNVFPSIHVINAIVVHDALGSIPSNQIPQRMLQGSFILMILIGLSTLLIKQHSIADVMAGIVIAKGVVYVYRVICDRDMKGWKIIKRY